MKIKYSTLLIFLVTVISLSISSCAKNNGEHSNLINCPFVYDANTEDGFIDDDERGLMEECFATKLIDANEIKNNLIGEWQLIGYGNGWIGSVSQPCCSITFTETEMIFDYEDRFFDTLTIHSWEIETIIINTSQSLKHRLQASPNLDVWLGLGTFCEQYIYNDATPSDGNMYLFEKVN